ncbi:SusD/RagB family nutrient-binding outer membrane lipoprotein [Salinimicrobium soli]|uniref:SusD/RagB family nutrient-binding outer membrane lipoprotein n=1 Tax=Salinimicrobium soli TaxID=1254399 RepID=UPI003AAE09CC
MKQIAALMLLLVISLSSCTDDWIDSDLNIDPDAPSDVPMNLLLPAIEQSMGYLLGGNDAVRTTSIWMQQFDGTARQSFTEARYQLTPADVNNLWNSVYTAIFMNLHEMVEKSKTQDSPHYTGVGQVLQASTLGIMTDLFGAMPFSEAFQGASNVLKPAYDEQEVLYDTIFAMLDDAVVNLNAEDNVLDVEGDVIYDGDMDQWTKAAYSFKARAYMQLGNVLGNEAYTKALEAAQNGFTSTDDNFVIPFEDANRNPIFQFMEQRGDIRMASTFVELLTSEEDPRLPFFVAEDADGNFVGSEPGSSNEAASEPGDYVADEVADVVLMSYAELKFIEAEAYFRLNQLADAQTALEEAVEASMIRVTGSAQSDWVDNNIVGVPLSLESILQQKYINGFGTTQPYADWRRTGLPTLDLAAGAVLQQIPTRFPYPQSEYDYNSANVPANVTITNKLWWDQ